MVLYKFDNDDHHHKYYYYYYQKKTNPGTDRTSPLMDLLTPRRQPNSAHAYRSSASPPRGPLGVFHFYVWPLRHHGSILWGSWGQLPNFSPTLWCQYGTSGRTHDDDDHLGYSVIQNKTIYKQKYHVPFVLTSLFYHTQLLIIGYSGSLTGLLVEMAMPLCYGIRTFRS